MKKALNNIVIKISVIFLSFFIFIGFVISVFSVGYMLFNDFYTLSYTEVRAEIIEKLAKKEIYNLIERFSWNSEDTEEYYSDKNVYYEIIDRNGEVFTNYNGDSVITTIEEKNLVNKYYTYDGECYSESEVYYSYDKNNSGWYTFEDVEVNTESNFVIFKIYIPQKMKYTDTFFMVNKLITFGYNNKVTLIITTILFFVLSVFIYSCIFISAGHSKDEKIIHISKINNIPIDVVLTFIILLSYIVFLMFSEIIGFINFLIMLVVSVPILYFIGIWFLISLAVQIKAGKLIKHTLLFFVYKQIKKIARLIFYIFKNLGTVYKAAISLSILLIVQVLFIIINFYEYDNLIIGWLLYSAILTAVLILSSISFGKIKKGTEKVVAGDLNNKINTEYMYGDIKELAENINNIDNGLQVAIKDKMKSEHFKTELITNVSHDIKTPLTSIINYVDLIKKEDCSDEKINKYIDVLERQSFRLKKLIEDLVEASKATTGNINIELTKCNLSVLINQAIGEFDERLEKSNLFLIQKIENQDICVLADGRRLWRVFDNLLNNICKYAMSGTRVYVELKTENEKAIITFKNISSEQITVSGEDLTERFVRGDRSRNTEGNGLGLSIAKNLTTLQNGEFKVETDGDLFKAIITFNIFKENNNE